MDLIFDGVIFGNGCYIEYENKVIFHKPLTLEQCTHFVDWCKEHDLVFRLECNDGMFLRQGYIDKSRLARYQYTYGRYVDYTGKPEPGLAKHMISGENLYRENVNKTASVLKTYQDFLDAKEEFKDLTVDTWGGKGELALYGAVRSKGFDKQNAVSKLLEYAKADPKDAIAFGDGVVDIPMFHVCGYSVAMGNANDEVKNSASCVTNDVYADRLYKAFKELKLI